MDELMGKSKYNLKKAGVKGIHSNVTYVCSCISCKRKRNGKSMGNSSSNLNCTEEDASDTSENDDDEGSFEIKNNYKKSNRRVKRVNEKACNFRIKFKYIKEGDYYIFNNRSNLHHNHPPQSHRFNQVRKDSIILKF
jgi:hypothetical protein